jgi:hypothetical protein
MLSTYRANARIGGALAFGQNAIVLSGIERNLHVGDSVQARLAFD